MLTKIIKCDKCGQKHHVLVDGPCPLSRKIAEWIGLKLEYHRMTKDGVDVRDESNTGQPVWLWKMSSGGYHYIHEIDFLHSLNACYQYIEPKLRPKTLMSETFKYRNQWRHSYSLLGYNTPTLASRRLGVGP